MEAMLIINAALVIIAALLSALALYSTGKLRQTVIDSIRGGSENAGSVRSALVETKKAMATLDVQIETINSKVAEHERALTSLRNTIEEVRGIVRPSTAANSSARTP
jgi:septal ring factor EnvC (AmiA/AmiB activator)